MTRLALISCIALMVACGEPADGGSRSSTGGTSGAGGTGGSGVTEEHDATCRAFCANEPEGSTCGPGVRWGGTIQQCYEGCLNELTQAQCKAEWVAQLECHLDLDCDDIFGDCDRANLEEAWRECEESANDRAFCAENCPEFDQTKCAQDTTLCEAVVFCEQNCPGEEVGECTAQVLLSGSCGGAFWSCDTLNPAPGGCADECPSGSDSECGLGTFCLDGACEARCTASQGCSENQTCNVRGRCVLDLGQ